MEPAATRLARESNRRANIERGNLLRLLNRREMMQVQRIRAGGRLPGDRLKMAGAGDVIGTTVMSAIGLGLIAATAWAGFKLLTGQTCACRKKRR